MKLKKKHIIWGIVASGFLVFCYATLLPHNTKYVMKLDETQKNIKAVKSEDNDSSDDFKNLYSFSVKVNNEVLKVPTDLSDFIDEGWKSTNEIGEDPFEFIPIEHTEFIKNDTIVYVMIDATEVYPLLMDKYYISTVLITEDLYKEDKVELPKGIILGESNKETILETYGEPDDIWDYEEEPVRMFYQYDKNQMIMLSLNEEGLLSEVMLSYEKPKEALDFSIVDSNQEYVENLPDTFNGNMFILDHVVYNLPDTTMRLLENGWVPMQEEEFVAGGPNEKSLIDFQKGDQIVNVELRNPNDHPTPIEECYVVSISFDLDTCQNFSFAGGLDALSTLEDFRKLDKDFQVKEVHMDKEIMTAFRIKTGVSSQFEVLMDYEENSKIRGFRMSNYPK